MHFGSDVYIIWVTDLGHILFEMIKKKERSLLKLDPEASVMRRDCIERLTG